MNEEELIQETRRLIGRWDNVRIVGQGWSGDARRGFQFYPIPSRSGSTATPVKTSGACCPAEGDCFIATQAICEAGGGTYQGDDVPCDPDPCTPPDCGSNTSTLCKCGYPEFVGFVSTPPKYYLERRVTNRTRVNNGPSCNGTTTCFNIFLGNYEQLTDYVGTYDPDTCVQTETNGTLHAHSVLCDGTPSSATLAQVWIEPTAGQPTSGTSAHGTSTGTVHVGAPCTPEDVTDDDSADMSLANEYTTALLISNTEAQFVSDFGPCPDGCVMTYILNEDESCCTVSCIPA